MHLEGKNKIRNHAGHKTCLLCHARCSYMTDMQDLFVLHVGLLQCDIVSRDLTPEQHDMILDPIGEDEEYNF